MNAPGDGRSATGRFGVARAILAIVAVLLVAAAVITAAVRFFRGGESDLSAVLSRMDTLLSEPSRSAEVSSLADEGDRILGSGNTGVEPVLSVLKRRRVLATRAGEYPRRYLAAALKAAERFPHSDSICAAVVDAALSCPAEDPTASASLRTFAPRLELGSFAAMRAAAANRLGETAQPSADIPSGMLLAAADSYYRSGPAGEALSVDAALVLLVGGDDLGARTIARDRLTRFDSLSPPALRFLAELEYDFGDRRQSAALFSRLEGELAALRRADAAYLAGDLSEATAGWIASAGASPALSSLALFNLASTSRDPDSARSYVRRLVASSPGFSPGIVLYSRLFGDAAILSSLEGQDGDGLVSLEKIRAGAPAAGYERSRALLWMLLNAHPKLEAAAEWAAWYFSVNGDPDESKLIAGNYARDAGASFWTNCYEGLAAAREGRLDDAEKAFGKATSSSGDWRLAANVGLLYEARRKLPESLRSYEIAASLHPEGADAAEIQLRISRILRALGRASDSERTLNYALDLDPDNRRIRTELKKAFGAGAGSGQ